MKKTKLFIREEKYTSFMGELRLEELAQEFSKELDISLKPRPLDDTVTSHCTYWMTGKNEDYTLDHTLLIDDEGNYTVITEEIKFALPTNKGCKKEFWELNAETFPDGKTYFSIHYHNQRAYAEKSKKKMQQLEGNKILQRLYNALQAEFALVTDLAYLQDEKDSLGDVPPSECLDVDLEDVTLEELKELPKFIKEFYRVL